MWLSPIVPGSINLWITGRSKDSWIRFAVVRSFHETFADMNESVERYLSSISIRLFLLLSLETWIFLEKNLSNIELSNCTSWIVYLDLWDRNRCFWRNHAMYDISFNLLLWTFTKVHSQVERTFVKLHWTFHVEFELFTSLSVPSLRTLSFCEDVTFEESCSSSTANCALEKKRKSGTTANSLKSLWDWNEARNWKNIFSCNFHGMLKYLKYSQYSCKKQRNIFFQNCLLRV